MKKIFIGSASTLLVLATLALASGVISFHDLKAEVSDLTEIKVPKLNKEVKALKDELAKQKLRACFMLRQYPKSHERDILMERTCL